MYALPSPAKPSLLLRYAVAALLSPGVPWCALLHPPRLFHPPPSGLVNATQEAMQLMTLGVRTRAEGMQRAMVASAGGLANSAGESHVCHVTGIIWS